MEEKSGDFDAINNQVDIGGPAMGRSGTKGGRIVLVDEDDFEWAIRKLIEGGGQLNQRSVKWLHAKTASWIAKYTATETVFRVNQLRPE